MKYGKMYWGLVIVLGVLLLMLGVVKYGSQVSLTGMFIESQAGLEVIGNQNAENIVLFYCDYQNYYCFKANELAKSISSDRNDIAFEIMQYPVENKPYDMKSAVAAVCAQKQGYLLPLHEKLLENYSVLDEGKILSLAQGIEGINNSEFLDCFDDAATQKAVLSSLAEGKVKGAESVPAFVFENKVSTGTNMEVIREDILSWFS